MRPVSPSTTRNRQLDGNPLRFVRNDILAAARRQMDFLVIINTEVHVTRYQRAFKGKPMKYHIKWLGYEDPADDSWEPEGDLTRDGTDENMHLNQYKQENNLQ